MNITGKRIVLGILVSVAVGGYLDGVMPDDPFKSFVDTNFNTFSTPKGSLPDSTVNPSLIETTIYNSQSVGPDVYLDDNGCVETRLGWRPTEILAALGYPKAVTVDGTLVPDLIRIALSEGQLVCGVER